MATREPVDQIPDHLRGETAPSVRAPDRPTPATWVSLGGLLGAVAASSCCVIPFTLVTLGVSGAWIGTLTKLASYQPAFLAVALGLLATGFVLVYRRPPAVCGDDAHCARPASHRLAKAALWTATVLVAAAMAFPYVVGRFLDG